MTRLRRISKRDTKDERTLTIEWHSVPHNEKGRGTAAVIDLKKHKELWEDIEDVLVPQSSKHEKRIPFEKVRPT